MKARTGRGASAVLLVALIQACGTHVYHRVQQGETLHAISQRYGRDFQQVARWNDLNAPYTIYQGDWLRVAPPADDNPRPPDGADQEGVDQAGEPVTSAVSVSPEADATESAKPAQTEQSLERWRWPTTGKLMRGFKANEPGAQGLVIAGRLGQPVRAAAAGEVVYVGTGLLRYGRLIIIKHGSDFLSAYAHNRKVRVEEGQRVAMGDHIADMGHRGEGSPQLHFEIRRRGEPVDPQIYLPDKQP